MSDVQKYFEEFHEAIRIDYDLSSDLREKRDIIVKRIKKYLNDNDLPGIEVLLQGSYPMKVGVKPLGDDRYDIDVGLRFAIKDTEYSAETVHGWVYSAVKNHTDEVKRKGPCTRVIYADGFHVDLVAYAVWDHPFGVTQYRLAHRKDGWRPADPPKLLESVEQSLQVFAGTEDSVTKTNQFRRVVRYLRRWVDRNVPKSRRPIGLALVVLCMKHLTVSKTWAGDSDDRNALIGIASSLTDIPGRITACKPAPEYEDLMAAYSDDDIKKLKEQLASLEDTLITTKDEPDPVEACKLLAQQFGEDFPVPSPEDTGKKTKGPAIVTSSTSA